MSPQNDTLRKYWPILLLVFLPLVLGLIAFAVARMVLQPGLPFLYTADLGVAGVIFGATIRDPGGTNPLHKLDESCPQAFHVDRRKQPQIPRWLVLASAYQWLG